jgi:hypothetical protein
MLIAIWLLKLTAIYNAIFWISKKGSSYRAYINNYPPHNQNDYFRAFKKSGGKFVPFGVKDFELHELYSEKFASQRRGSRDKSQLDKQSIRDLFSPVLQFSLKIFKDFLFRAHHLTFISGIYLFVSIALDKLSQNNILEQKDWLLFFLSLTMFISNTFLSVESIYARAILGNYARNFHLLENNNSLLMQEIKIFVGMFITTILSGTFMCYVSYVLYDSFSGKIAIYEASNPLSWFQILFECFYFTMTTFFTVGYGDISPNNWLGQLIAIFLMIQSFLLIIVVFASLMSVKSDS